MQEAHKVQPPSLPSSKQNWLKKSKGELTRHEQKPKHTDALYSLQHLIDCTCS